MHCRNLAGLALLLLNVTSACSANKFAAGGKMPNGKKETSETASASGDTTESDPTVENIVSTEDPPSTSGAGGASATPSFSSSGVYSFGNVIVGTSVTATVNLTNSDDTAATLSQAAVQANLGFSIVGGTCASNLAAKSSCTYEVRFSPAALGPVSSHLADMISGSSTTSLSLNGNGMSPAGSPIKLFATNLTNTPVFQFGNVPIGTSVKTTVTLTNSGGTTAPVTGTAIQNPGFRILPGGTCTDGPLAAGSSCTYVVEFTPYKAGSISSAISVLVNNQIYVDAYVYNVAFVFQGYGI